MKSSISFICLLFLLYLLHNIVFYYRDIQPNKDCKSIIRYLPIPEMIENEFKLNF